VERALSAIFSLSCSGHGGQSSHMCEAQKIAFLFMGQTLLSPLRSDLVCFSFSGCLATCMLNRFGGNSSWKAFSEGERWWKSKYISWVDGMSRDRLNEGGERLINMAQSFGASFLRKGFAERLHWKPQAMMRGRRRDFIAKQLHICKKAFNSTRKASNAESSENRKHTNDFKASFEQSN
jgi:hypothetical protein